MITRVGKQVSFDEPGSYRIKIQGELDERLSDRLGGMRISKSETDDGGVVTTLYGVLPDQAALLGVQIALYELHLPVLSVERMKSRAGDDRKSRRVKIGHES